ncbi:zinc finger protein [Aphelenchoides avenae]|nr:zinc finger protein [Aphelenchus avenae]
MHLLRHQSTVHNKEKPFQCAECSVKFSRKYHLDRHVERFHNDLTQSPKRKPFVEPATVSPPPAKRIKDEPTFAEVLLNVIESTARSVKSSNEIEPHQSTIVPSTVNDEEEQHANTASLTIRLRSTVQFKTSCARVLVVKDQPASLTFGAFRKLFGIPPDSPKLIIFKKSAGDVNDSDEWLVAVGDDMSLPLVDGRIVAETCTDL